MGAWHKFTLFDKLFYLLFNNQISSIPLDGLAYKVMENISNCKTV